MSTTHILLTHSELVVLIQLWFSRHNATRVEARPNVRIKGCKGFFFFPFGEVPNKWCRVENWKFLCFSWGLLGGRVDNLMEEFYFSFLSISFRPIRLASDAIFTALGRQWVSKLVATFCILSLFSGHSICFCSSKVVTSFSFNFQ